MEEEEALRAATARDTASLQKTFKQTDWILESADELAFSLRNHMGEVRNTNAKIRHHPYIDLNQH